ncbi:DUF6492 family protein [Arthrobacter sp. UNC362MFTsu5.1]|jgi:hypothetical protein|uniref:DUF6492 family protein n=1 Tax=Arthrobacter sp. UNC362MFTsu5.1 TaxID=1449044 RepID=UPI00068EC1DA|nr:DUF6492 family protein [Arthrobacter sp. UNC362MFTsu5.1]
MNTIAILTPSFRPDYERFVRLHQSVLEFTAESVVHHVIVPRRDLELFRSLASPRLRVWAEADFLPDGFIPTAGLAAAVKRVRILPAMLRFSALNLRRPWPPVRGWVLQQILKLSAARQLGCGAVVIIDSDVELLRTMSTDLFFKDGTVRLYEKPDAVTDDMGRHVLWTRTAHKLLGLPAPEPGARPDYVAGIVTWDPELLTGCLARIEAVTGTPWATAVGAQLHISEFILYGTYVQHFGTEQQRSFVEPSNLCHSYWEGGPLTGGRLEDFIARFGSSDIAVQIQSNSGTSNSTTRHVLDELRTEINR